MALKTAHTALLFIGTYTRKESFVDGHGQGVYTLLLNKSDGTFSNLELYPEAGINPAYLTLTHNEKHLYVVNETEDHLTSDGRNKSGEVISFNVDKSASNQHKLLTLVSQQVSEGSSPCYVRTDKTDSVVYVSNYGSGTVALFPIQSNTGALANVADVKFSVECGSGVVPSRQEAPHYHCIVESPNNQFAFVADLGTDKIMQYKLDVKTVQYMSFPAIYKIQTNRF